MRTNPTRCRAHAVAATAAIVLLTAAQPGTARAQSPGGFQINRYEPSPAGEATFAVDRPWYSSQRSFAVGLTLNYAHNPLVFGIDNNGAFTTQYSVIEHALLGHVDFAFSFLDRVTLNLSLPLTLKEWAGGATTPAGLPDPGVRASDFAVGDPRVGLMVRLWNHMERNAFSIHLGANVWIPIGGDGTNRTLGVGAPAGDSTVRFQPRLVVGGIFVDHLRWSVSGGFYYRPNASIGDQKVLFAAGSNLGPELTLGATLSYTDSSRRLNVGPELVASTILVDKDGGHAFEKSYTSVEVLLGAQYLVADAFQVGLAVGTGAAREPGTPDFRALLRLAYAPLAGGDRDKDGVLDSDDACPDVAGPRSSDRAVSGCPDRDADGVADGVDLCPDTPRGNQPDPRRPGCPLAGDKDGDGVADDKDVCPEVAQGKLPDPARPGCPKDSDGDGVIDEKDACLTVPAGSKPDPDAGRAGCPQDTDFDGIIDEKDACPAIPAGKIPDPARPGCPLDTDGDGVMDEDDQCVKVPAGLAPDPGKRGCPLADRDGDTVPDKVDACPTRAGAPDPDPKKNGCPGLVQVTRCSIRINEPVFFATDKDVILPRSFPVLQAVSIALRLTPQIKRAAVEGHTDPLGTLEHNMDLSERRAKSVLAWLASTGAIAAERLEAHGYGPTRPIADNRSAKGRAANRRVDFVILDPVCPDQAAPAGAPAPARGAGRPPGRGKRAR